METIMKWWESFKAWNKARKEKKELDKRYKEKMKQIKKKDPYTYD